MKNKSGIYQYKLLTGFGAMYLSLSLLMRVILLVVSISNAAPTLASLIRIFGFGLLFDIGVAVFFLLPYATYLLLFPAKFSNSIINKLITYSSFFLGTLVLMFSFFAELTFWLEFESRFNFIAVDYLVYTYEVVQNINESYPLPVLISCMVLAALLITWLFVKQGIFRNTFNYHAPFRIRIAVWLLLLGLGTLYSFFISNQLAETGHNRYQNELSKSGIYSFFSAFRNNELNYDQFYRRINNETAFSITRNALQDPGTRFLIDEHSIRRKIIDSGTEVRPNVILVTIESLSADFMDHFGNKQHLTPILDSLAKQNILFENMYATGTRTVRGMEALTLAIPPTPGSSIVRRPDNDNLFTVGAIFRSKQYATGFFYGGDGYFDNMNQFFGSNGYDITDKGRKLMVGDRFAAARYQIPDSTIHFRNAWGICDEDVYDAVIRDANQKHREGKPFFDFVMTTSNHRPFTYPDGKINIPSGSGREGAVRYTDYAIGQFLAAASKQPWSRNTVIIFIADHCASSAGKNEIDVSKYHIPAIICNLPGKPSGHITKLCSQVDLFPTLFGILNWNYVSNLYGMNVLEEKYQPRAFLGTYQKLVYLKQDSLVILSPQQKVETYKYLFANNEQLPAAFNGNAVNEAIAFYQSAYYLYKNGGLKY
ncbi:LTA synthase family protein [Pseudoflavitalea rhizosphaerae]|uniref:LTA synthase family protein n=1 Tax=Pseudoflavitalea rhizosphaerae TaxID=1884793 RepID=UPI000F8CF03F|nr:alkaline phosphatase family protein [Pseudoflavitalea rhizosphaerae]